MDYTTFCLYGIEHSTARLATLIKYIYIYIYINIILNKNYIVKRWSTVLNNKKNNNKQTNKQTKNNNWKCIFNCHQRAYRDFVLEILTLPFRVHDWTWRQQTFEVWVTWPEVVDGSRIDRLHLKKRKFHNLKIVLKIWKTITSGKYKDVCMYVGRCMYMCMYACMCVCMNACIYIYIYVWLHLCIVCMSGLTIHT